MLINFNVKNFKSFKDLQNFSMYAGTTKLKSNRLFVDKNISALKFSAIFGANASGKSNFVEAIQKMRDLVVNGIPKYITNVYYKLDPNFKSIPSYFEVILYLNNKVYSYGFEFISSLNKFSSEWMYELRNDNSEKLVFERDVVKKNFNDEFEFSADLKNKIDVYKDEIKSDPEKLFLNLIYSQKNLRNEKELKYIINIYEWFLKSLNITSPNSILTSGDYFIIDERINEMSNLLKIFDTGIIKMDKVKVNNEIATKFIPDFIIKLVKEDFAKKPIKVKKFASLVRNNDSMWIISSKNDDEMSFEQICFYHDSEEKVQFTMGEESDGTNRLIELAEILLTNDDNKVYLIDELDRCLHPQLTYHFVSEFLKKATSKNTQLIVTTHESRLLNFDLLRRDEIWFVDKKNGNSKIYSLEEFNVRFDKKIDKAYLDGRYGGVPIFETVFPIE